MTELDSNVVSCFLLLVLNLCFRLNEFNYSVGDGTYALKKVLIQSSEQLELVREEIRISSLFSHPNLLPLLDHAIIAVKVVNKDVFFSFLYLL